MSVNYHLKLSVIQMETLQIVYHYPVPTSHYHVTDGLIFCIYRGVKHDEFTTLGRQKDQQRQSIMGRTTGAMRLLYSMVSIPFQI
jgi:hypothetical protein